MPNVQQVLGEEIRRLAKKEARAAIEDLKEQISALKKTVSEQGKLLKELSKLTNKTAAIVLPPEAPKPEVSPEEMKAVRVSPERIAKWRKNIGVSQTQFAKLLGVSHLSVNHWALQDVEGVRVRERRGCGVGDGKRGGQRAPDARPVRDRVVVVGHVERGHGLVEAIEVEVRLVLDAAPLLKH